MFFHFCRKFYSLIRGYFLVRASRRAAVCKSKGLWTRSHWKTGIIACFRQRLIFYAYVAWLYTTYNYTGGKLKWNRVPHMRVRARTITFRIITFTCAIREDQRISSPARFLHSFSCPVCIYQAHACWRQSEKKLIRNVITHGWYGRGGRKIIAGLLVIVYLYYRTARTKFIIVNKHQVLLDQARTAEEYFWCSLYLILYTKQN